MIARSLAFVLALLTAGCSRCQPGAPPPARPSEVATRSAAALDPAAAERARLERIAERSAVLARDVIAFWKAHGPDREHGGFHGTLARDGRPIEPTDKGLVQQARHLWTMSIWYQRREAAPGVKALADDLYRFLEAHFRDGDGEYFYKVAREGAPLDKKKVLYAESFVIFALAEYSRAFGVAEARERALACFRSIDARAHDAAHGGYDQTHDPAWLSPGAAKETNTHLHLLEAFTTLYEVTADATVRARLEELVRVFVERIVQPADYAHKEFLLDWRPFGDAAVSYGHDLETAWLLFEALRALGRQGDARVRDAALRVATLSASQGFDERLGGYFEEGSLGGPPEKLEKVWWIQAEALPGLFRLYAERGDETALDRLERTLDFIERYQRDADHGEWYWSILRDGRLGEHGGNKGEEWKASYHTTRALVFTEDWIRERLKGVAPGAGGKP